MGKTYRKGFKQDEYSKRDGFTRKERAGSCCNHGGCPVCEGNRTYQDKKARSKTELTNKENSIEMEDEDVLRT